MAAVIAEAPRRVDCVWRATLPAEEPVALGLLPRTRLLYAFETSSADYHS